MSPNSSGPETSTAVEDGGRKSDLLGNKIDFQNSQKLELLRIAEQSERELLVKRAGTYGGGQP